MSIEITEEMVDAVVTVPRGELMRLLTDVSTACDFVSSRAMCKELAERLSDRASRLRSAAVAPLMQAKVPDYVTTQLARRCLWLAFVWNDHNFERADVEARKEAEKHGIHSFEEANEWIAAAPEVQS
jgi:hypothetical protein